MKHVPPIDDAIGGIVAALRKRQAVVVVAPPGAGKTTRVPPALLQNGPVIVLQPRRTAARSIAARIARERGWTLGREVGWHVRFERHLCRQTQLVLATEGILTSYLTNDPLLSEFNTIVLDEFHERSLHADLAVALSKQALRARPDLRLVVMSATIDAGRVSSFLDDCPVISVPGSLHPVQVQYRPDADLCGSVEEALRNTSGHVLCFQPGAAEIRRAISTLRPKLDAATELVPLHGTLSAAEQDTALNDHTGSRRVLVSTNIAETSLTIPGVTAVVDFGTEKVARYDPGRAIDSLITERITQAGADQRAGRAGRLGPGLVYRLWNATDRLRPYREPEITRADLTSTALDIVAWGGDPKSMQWFDAPRPEAMEAALRLLERLGAICKGRITAMGQQMQRLPLHPRLARILIAQDAHPDLIRATAWLSERTAVANSGTAASDLLQVLDEWFAAPAHVHQIARQLEKIALVGLGKSERTPKLSEAEFCRAILAGFPDRVARRRAPHATTVLLASGTGATLSADSCVRNHEFLVALDARTETRGGEAVTLIRLASGVNPEWLDPTHIKVEHRIDDAGVVRAVEVHMYFELRLQERPVAVDPQCAADLLTEAWLARQRTPSEEQLLRRLSFAQTHVDVPRLIADAAYGAASLGTIDLEVALPAATAAALERYAPPTLLVPSGRKVALEYQADNTVSASVKLQELFGLAETPRIGPRQERVLLSLLAPNGRPVQMTRDLRSFWERTYPEVRKELRGRYPKHPWPEDPWTAVPTHRAKSRSRTQS